MRSVDRTRVAEPSILKKPYPSDDKTELERVEAHRRDPEKKEKSFEFSRYKEISVKAALETLFHGKCAYCESFYAGTQPVDVEHYRPKGEVEDVPEHPGYWWLAMDWENLLPSCIDCNRKRQQKTPDPQGNRLVNLAESGDFDRTKKISTGKATAFPLAKGSPRIKKPGEDEDTEERLLIDPTRDNPLDDLVFYVDRLHLISLVCPKPLDPDADPALPAPDGGAGAVMDGANAARVSTKGAVSIQTYGLNRLGLVQARTKLLRDLEFLLALSVKLGEVAITLENRRDTAGSDADKAFYEDLALRIRQFQKDVLGQIKAKTSPQSAFSAVAQAWVEAFVAEPDA